MAIKYFIRLFLIISLTSPAYASTERIAALILRIGQYSTIEHAIPPQQVCVLNDTHFAEIISIALTHFPEYHPTALVPKSLTELKQCQIVWSGYPFWPNDDWVNTINQGNILWISDHAALFGRGVIILLDYDPNALRFRVQRRAALQKGIVFNARLLQLAQEIR